MGGGEQEGEIETRAGRVLIGGRIPLDLTLDPVFFSGRLGPDPLGLHANGAVGRDGAPHVLYPDAAHNRQESKPRHLDKTSVAWPKQIHLLCSIKSHIIRCQLIFKGKNFRSRMDNKKKKKNQKKYFKFSSNL